MGTTKVTIPLFALLLIGVVAHTHAADSVHKRQAECFSPFYKPAWCYGLGFPPYQQPFGFSGGFGGATPFGAGFGGGVGGGAFGFSGTGFQPRTGFGFGSRAGSGSRWGGRYATRGGGNRYGDYDEDEWEEEPHFEKYKAPRPNTRYPYGGTGAGAGSFAGSRTGFNGFGAGVPPFGFGSPYGQYGGAGAGFGFGAPFGSPFGSPFNFGAGAGGIPFPSMTSSGPGHTSTSGSSTFSFGPGGKTTQSTSNQMMTTQADDASWTIQSSGLQMDARPDKGTILVTADVGKPSKVEKEVVSEHEFQLNLSYKDEPKKWINMKVGDDGPNVSKMQVEERGGQVIIHGPSKSAGAQEKHSRGHGKGST